MNETFRNLIGATHKPYREKLIYLESTGTQYIDTGLNSANGYKYVAKIASTENGTWKIFWGRQSESSGTECEFFGYGNTTTDIGAFFSSAGEYTGKTNITLGEIYEIEMSSFPPDKYVSINGITSTKVRHTSYNANYNVYLFGLNNAGSATSANLSSVRVYYWKVYDENDQLIMSLIPVLDRNGVPCMYDEVSKTFFYNQGTGTFNYK